MTQNKAYHILRQFIQKTFPSMQREVMKRWLIDEKETAEKEAAVRQIWDETHAMPDESTDKSLHAAHQRIKIEEKKTIRAHRIKTLLRYAAIFMLPVISALSVWIPAKNNPAKIELITCYVPNGEQRIVDLSDGSNVQINAGSLFIYPKKFTQKEREVYLVGEANFAVAKNEEKPFIVHIKSRTPDPTQTTLSRF